MQNSTMKMQQASSYLSAGNADYLEEMYELFLQDPNAVSEEWRNYFRSLPKVNGLTVDVSHADIRKEFLQLARTATKRQLVVSDDALAVRKQYAVNQLINAYRTYGHLAAKLDPLARPRAPVLQLELKQYGLSAADAQDVFSAETLGLSKASLQEIQTRLQEIYCGAIGAEYMYITNAEEITWLQKRLEQHATSLFTAEQKRRILQLLIAADGLEKYLHNKYVGQKRFSLEGGDAFIPLMHLAVMQAATRGSKEVVIGMAHRGRLNILFNLMGQSAAEIFKEFEGLKDYGMTSGDVKYHNGFSSDIDTPVGPLHLSLAFNPSHLEAVSPVVMGSTRARQQSHNDKVRNEALAILIHGDASFSGQGVVMETLNMSQTHAYAIGGSLHIVINNQIGFTTSDIYDARSSLYCTDVAKMIEAPVFHVNGDDAEAVAFLAQLAIDYRMQFHKDVVIDLVCYRRHGHNEVDEPAATQPLMYHIIREHLTPADIYAKKLIAENICTAAEIDAMRQTYRDLLDKGGIFIKTIPDGLAKKYRNNWVSYINQGWRNDTKTSINKKELIAIAQRLEVLPQGFKLQPQVANMMSARARMTKGEQPCDWGYAEVLAYATILISGHSVRMTGQDCERGTFAHRHAILHDYETGKTYMPLAHINEMQANVEISNSLLSEMAVMGFEYGYATTDPNDLVLWEAQFGDFANGAQIIIDQFISSGWQKWRNLCDLVLLLPHGYEGAGPEHSSARLERFLQLCAEENMVVCVPSTPAQIFHLLRRQAFCPFRRPLIVMTPKSLLRHKLAVSTLDELADDKFKFIIPEIDAINPAQVRRVILCSGKVYYDLLTQRRERKITDIAILRIEQLYPFPDIELTELLAGYKKAKEVVWCQEEPKNQGAWYISRARIEECLAKGQTLYYAGRPASAAPAAGYMALHNQQQAQLVSDALAAGAMIGYSR